MPSSHSCQRLKKECLGVIICGFHTNEAKQLQEYSSVFELKSFLSLPEAAGCSGGLCLYPQCVWSLNICCSSFSY